MIAAGKRRATYADVLAAPSNVVAEVIRGTLYTNPRPAARHARAGSRLGTQLGGPFDLGEGGPGGWINLYEAELHLGEDPDILVPDWAGWRRARMPRVPLDDAFITLAPNWICEILSASTEAIDRSDKMDIYARENVEHVWLVDPSDKLLEAYRLESGRWVRIGAWRGDANFRAGSRARTRGRCSPCTPRCRWRGSPCSSPRR